MTTTAKDLRELVAITIDDNGAGTWRGGALYQPGDSAPVFFTRAPASPDRIITITVNRAPADHAWDVQVRCRGAVKGHVSAEDLADAVNDALHGLTGARGGTELVLLSFRFAARMGSDANDRDEVALNYRAVVNDPSTALID